MRRKVVSLFALMAAVTMMLGGMAGCGTDAVDSSVVSSAREVEGASAPEAEEYTVEINGKAQATISADASECMGMFEELGYDAVLDSEDHTIQIAHILADEVLRNRDTVVSFFAEPSKEAWSDYFTEDAVYRYSLGGKSMTEYLVYEETAADWLEQLSDDFLYVNGYEDLDIIPVFTPVNEQYNNLIMAKMAAAYTQDGEAVKEYWTLEFTFDENGKITMLRAALDPLEESYLERVHEGKYDYDSNLDPISLRNVNLSTIDKWAICMQQYRNVMRKCLVTEDATTDVFVGEVLEQPMWVGDIYDDYTEGWLDPSLTNDWGVYNLDRTGVPDKIFECADMPNVFLVDAIGYTSMSPHTGGPYSPNYFLHFTLKNDGYVCNFREQSHGLNRLDEGFVEP